MTVSMTKKTFSQIPSLSYVEHAAWLELCWAGRSSPKPQFQLAGNLFIKEAAAVLGHSSSISVTLCVVLDHNSKSALQSFSSTHFKGLTVVSRHKNRYWPHFCVPADVLEGASREMIFPPYYACMGMAAEGGCSHQGCEHSGGQVHAPQRGAKSRLSPR